MPYMYPLALAAHACMSVASVVRMSLPICCLKFHINSSAILHHVDCYVTNVKLRRTITPAQVLLALLAAQPENAFILRSHNRWMLIKCTGAHRVYKTWGVKLVSAVVTEHQSCQIEF